VAVCKHPTLLFFPGVLFAKQLQQGNFTVHSQTELHEGPTTVLQEVEAVLATSA
jgi:hypothetical protein